MDEEKEKMEKRYSARLLKEREGGDKYITIIPTQGRLGFWCGLCQTECSTESDLDLHLNNARHLRLVGFDRQTKGKANPWPFDDGCGFFPDVVPDLVVPDVRYNGVMSYLKVKHIGYGKISARIRRDRGEVNICRIWCEWLGKDVGGHVADKLPFAIVKFSYSNNLGRSLTLRSQSANWSDVNSKLHEVGYGRKCGVCNMPMHAGEDVGALLNLKSQRLICCNKVVGEFDMHHISCLIHWLLMLEYEAVPKQCDVKPKVEAREGQGHHNKEIRVYCPQCFGTGTGPKVLSAEQKNSEGSEVCRILMALPPAFNRWKESPEDLYKSSIGLRFPVATGWFFDPDDLPQEMVSPLRLLSFYQACVSGSDLFPREESQQIEP